MSNEGCTPLCKCLVTFGARLWPLFCVDPFMPHQLLSANNLSNFEQASGLSPVWVLSWLIRVKLCAKDLEHGNDMSPLWVISCSLDGHIVKMSFHIWGREMASVLCGLFHVFSNLCWLWMPCHIWNRKMASLLLRSLYASSIGHFQRMTCCIMASPLCGFFYVSSNFFCQYMTCHIMKRQMASS